MKPGKLYLKIFLSFLLILIVTEVLVFGLFLFSAGKIIYSRLERHTRTQVLMLREFVEDKLESEPETLPGENKSLKDFISQLGESHGSRIWLAAPDGTQLVKSFSGEIPEQLQGIPERRLRDLGDFKLYTDFKKGRFFYITIPMEVGKHGVGSLHILSERIEKDHHQWFFALGLAAVGFVIALLVIPVSRFITQPLKQLKESALRIAEGNLSHRATVNSKDEIGELGRTFNIMADKLERMIRGGKELTANISHELRSPLARIRVAEELLREKFEHGDYDQCHRQLDDIREDIEELDHLIDSILALSKLDIHERPSKQESVDLSDLIGELLEKFELALKRKNLRVATDLSFDRPFFGDRDALSTALANILDNTAKFTPENGDVTIRIHSEDDSVKIRVTNSFGTLSEEDLTGIFEPFYRTEKAHAGGSGLGLAISRKIIERHRGTIAAQNAPEGLRIEIDLPMGQDPQEKVP